jgi:hypothetical protein
LEQIFDTTKNTVLFKHNDKGQNNPWIEGKSGDVLFNIQIKNSQAEYDLSFYKDIPEDQIKAMKTVGIELDLK